jgi:hypothetical protein
MAVPDLPVSEQLAARYLQLPVGELVSLDDIAQIGEFLSFVDEQGAEIAGRLRNAERVSA